MSIARKFLIASHGSLASGIKSSLDIIVGPMGNIFLIEAYLNENKAIENDINDILKNISNDDELIIFTDILGGSVTNQIAQFVEKSNIHIVSGFSLPLIIEILLSDTETPIADVIETAIENAKGQMAYVNKLIHSNKDNLKDD
ncbi:MAG: hypothetical protein V4721_08605 [Bacteroidota bacterium]